MPASTSLVSTTASVDLTSCSLAAGLTVIFAFWKTFRAVAPHGTAGSHNATLTLLLARSATPVIRAGLPGGVAISIVLLTKLVGLAASPACTTVSMFFVDAEANTSEIGR